MSGFSPVGRGLQRKASSPQKPYLREKPRTYDGLLISKSRDTARRNANASSSPPRLLVSDAAPRAPAPTGATPPDCEQAITSSAPRHRIMTGSLSRGPMHAMPCHAHLPHVAPRPGSLDSGLELQLLQIHQGLVPVRHRPAEKLVRGRRRRAHQPHPAPATTRHMATLVLLVTHNKQRINRLKQHINLLSAASPRVVELVDQRDEAARSVPRLHREPRHPIHKDGVECPGQRHIVRGPWGHMGKGSDRSQHDDFGYDTWLRNGAAAACSDTHRGPCRTARRS